MKIKYSTNLLVLNNSNAWLFELWITYDNAWILYRVIHDISSEGSTLLQKKKIHTYIYENILCANQVILYGNYFK